MNLFAYWNSDKMVLSMYGAREVDERSAPELVGAGARSLRSAAGLPMPRVYIMDNPQPNAFATGRNPEHAAVAVTTGLLNTVTHEELAGVLAHELGHIKHRDTLTMTITATIAGAISMLANFGFYFGGRSATTATSGMVGSLALLILAPLAAGLVQMAISRTREYEADRDGAEISKRPLWLASALAEDRRRRRACPQHGCRAQPGDSAHLFIVNPLSGAAWTICSPPTRRREPHRAAAGDRARDGRGGRSRRCARPASERDLGPWSSAASSPSASSGFTRALGLMRGLPALASTFT